MQDNRLVWYKQSTVNLYKTFLQVYRRSKQICHITLSDEHDHFNAFYVPLPLMIETILLHSAYQWVKDNA